MKNKLLAGLWVLAFLSLPIYAFANNFLANGVVSSTGQTLPGTKVNTPNPPNVPANEQVTATEFNTVTGALNDISSFLLPVTGLVDAGQALATNPAYSLTLDAGFVGNLTVGAFSAGAYPYTSNADPRTTNNGVVYSVSAVGDFDSLVPSYVADRAYQNQCSAGIPNWQVGVAPPQAGSAFNSAVDLNPIGSTAFLVQIARFSLPPDAGSAIITAYMRDGGANTGSPAVGFADYNCATNLGTTAASLTPTMTAFSKTLAGLSPNHNYYGGVILNQAGFGASATSDPITGPIQVKPIGATGLFAGDFWRIGANSRTLWANSRDTYQQDGTFNASPGAYMVIQTDAPTMAVEMENTTTSVLALSISIFVNGQPFATYQPTQSSDVGEFATFTLPTGLKEVQVIGSVQTQTGTAFDNRGGTYLDALYVPATATTTVRMPPPQRSLIFYGDSICQGTSFPVPNEGGFTSIIRGWFNGKVATECEGSRSLGEDLSDGGGYFTIAQGNLPTLTNYLSVLHPTDIWVQMGTNDYAGSGFTAQFVSVTQFQNAYGALLDALHQRNPAANIYAQSMLYTTTESTPVNGFLPSDYRTAVANACGARGSWCTFVDGTTLLAASEISGVHPLASAHSHLARSVMAVLNGVANASIQPTYWAPNTFNTVTADAGFFPGALAVGGGAPFKALEYGTCTLSSGTCNAVVLGATGSSSCYCGIQGTYARDAGAVTCSAQADAGSATCYCYYATLIADPAPAPVGIHCDN